jgi:AAA domain, putative AbiEii toxin, Type IV TA system/AAA ATPase domain
MYIRELHIRNLKLLKDFKLRFYDAATGESRRWTVLVGRNARGKTSVLQAIALAAAGPTLANSLARSSLMSFFDRRQEPAAEVEIDAEFELPPLNEVGKRPVPERSLPELPAGADGKRLGVSLRLPPGQTILRGASWYGEMHGDSHRSSEAPLERARAADLPWWFVAGYGVDRRLELDSRKVDRRAEERLRSLFEPVPPIGLGFADRQSYGDHFATAFKSLLRKVLRKDPRTVPLINDIELRGAGGVSLRDLAEKDKFSFEIAGKAHKMPATYLSHGYQSTLAWVADLVGHFLLDLDGKVITEPRNLSGLVLVDELDLFLHPDWQADFIDALSTTFPNLQFVATTHSPLLISKLRPEQVVQLEWDDEGSIEARPFEGDPRLMTATDLYRQLFGITNPPPTELARVLSRYEYLGADAARTDAEDEELQRLRAELEHAGVRHLATPKPRVRTVS